MALKKKILEHPRNEKISFDKETHTYKHEDTIFEGVTSWIGKYTEPFDADKISYFVAKKRGVSPQTILDEWADARDYGNFVHETIEGFVNNGLDLDTKELNLFKEFIEKHNLTPLVSEWVVYDEDINRASAIDLLFERDGKLFIYDLKTMAKPIKYNSYQNKVMDEPLNELPDSKYYKQALQVNIYKYWLENKYNLEVSPVNYVLRLRNDICERIPILDMETEIKELYNYE